MSDSDVNVQEHIEENDDAGWVFAGFAMLTAAIQLSITVYHAKQLHRDLSTTNKDDRKLLFPHRRNAPELTPQYKRIAGYTMASILVYNLYTIGQTLKYSSTSSIECTIWTDTQATGNLAGKLFFYLVLLARLFQIYEKSAYCYPIYCIKWFGILLIAYNAFVWILYLIFVRAFVDTFGNGYAYPNFCGPGSQDNPDDGIGIEYAASGFALVLEDIASVSVFYWAYRIPLKKARKLIESDPKYNKDKILHKVMYAGQKTKVLLLTSSLSTLTVVFVAVITGVTVIICADPIINSLVLMFMTAYYPDYKYYHRWCKPCIKCCDREGLTSYTKTKRSAMQMITSQSEDKSVNATTIDTGSQLRDIVEKLKLNYEGKHGVVKGGGYNNLSDKMLVVIEEKDNETKVKLELTEKTEPVQDKKDQDGDVLIVSDDDIQIITSQHSEDEAP